MPRHWHPDYDAAGRHSGLRRDFASPSPATARLRRCSFCALAFHQGRMVQVRSRESIMREAEELTHDPEFKGYINDVGGPTANFFKPACKKQLTHGVCKNRRCRGRTSAATWTRTRTPTPSCCATCARSPGVEGLRAQRHPLRLHHGRRERQIPVELLQHHVSGQLRLRARTRERRGALGDGQAAPRGLRRVRRALRTLSAEYGLSSHVGAVPHLELPGVRP